VKKTEKHIVEVYVFQDKLKYPIPFTQGTDALPVEFQFKDWEIPAGVTASAFVTKPSGKGVQSGATADYVDNSVIVDVDAQMVAEVGTSYMQLQLSKDEKNVFTFNQPISVKKSATQINSENGSAFLDEYIKKCDTAASAADAARENIEQTAQSGGFSATIRIGKTETGPPNTAATVENVGTVKDAVFNFVIPSGPQGLSGITAPSAGMFTLIVDSATGNLYVDYPDGTEPPEFVLEENGDLYFVTHREDDGTVARILIGNVRVPLADNTTTATPGIYALDAHQGKVIGEKIDKIAKLLEKVISTD